MSIRGPAHLTSVNWNVGHEVRAHRLAQWAHGICHVSREANKKCLSPLPLNPKPFLSLHHSLSCCGFGTLPETPWGTSMEPACGQKQHTPLSRGFQVLPTIPSQLAGDEASPGHEYQAGDQAISDLVRRKTSLLCPSPWAYVTHRSLISRNSSPSPSLLCALLPYHPSPWATSWSKSEKLSDARTRTILVLLSRPAVQDPRWNRPEIEEVSYVTYGHVIQAQYIGSGCGHDDHNAHYRNHLNCRVLKTLGNNTITLREVFAECNTRQRALDK